MASWNDLTNYIKGEYKVEKEFDDGLLMLFNLGNGRSQLVGVKHLTNGEEEWVKIESPIGNFGEIDLQTAVRLTEHKLTGGISAMGDMVTIADSFPLLNLDMNEFESPLAKIVTTADSLEQQLTGRDQY